MTLPRSTMATASQVRSTSSSRCEDSTTVRPSATSDRIMSRISCMPAGSRPFIGSSRISSCGIADQAGGDAEPLAHAHRVLRHPVVGPMQDPDPLQRRRRCGRAPRVRAPRPASAGSAGRSDGRGTAARRRSRRPAPAPRRDAWAPGSRAATSCPASAWVSPSSTRISVVLPAPFGTEVAERAPPRDQQIHAVDGDVGAEPLRQPTGLHRPGTVTRTFGRRRNHVRHRHGHRPGRQQAARRDASRASITVRQPP